MRHVGGPPENPEPLHPGSEYLIGVDSDGCAFDSMELKHRSCFCPAFIRHWNLQPVSEPAEEVWYFVNLYSWTRGLNRFPALVRALELLETHPGAVARKFRGPDLRELREWIGSESRLGNAALEKQVRDVQNGLLVKTLRWSRGINDCVARKGQGIRVFSLVTGCLEKASGKADIMVVSQTPQETLESEWKKNGISRFVRVIAGQEQGTKTEQLRRGSAGRYESGKVLMIGDAPGDLRAAGENGALFYPILPGREESSWERFQQEAMDRFFRGEFEGPYQDELISEFQRSLPRRPPWNP